MKWDGEYRQPTWVDRLRCRLFGHQPHPLWDALCGRCGDMRTPPGVSADHDESL